MILYRRDVTIFGERQTVNITPLTLLVLLAIVLRIPSLFEPYWYGDEAIYLTLGEGIRQGLGLYKDIFDHKPPLIYLLAAVSGSLYWFKFALLVSSTISIVLFWKLAKRIFEGKLPAIILATTIFTLLATLPTLEGNIANAELFMLAPTIGAFLLLSDPQKVNLRRTFFAGLLFSLSILYKVPGIFDLATICTFWVFAIKSIRGFGRVLGYLVILFAGVLLPILAISIYFAAVGAWGPFVQAVGLINVNYISRWGTGGGGGSILANAFFVRSMVLVAVLGATYIFKKYFSFQALFICLWMSFALFAALLSGRPYPHYLIQIIPAFSLAIALLTFGKIRERLLPIPFLLILGFSVVFYKFSHYQTYPYYKNFILMAVGQRSREQYFSSFDSRVPKIYNVSSMLVSRTAPTDRVFIWGTAPEIYALSRRVPPVQYVTSFHIGDFGTSEETMRKLSLDKPKYVLIMPEETRTLTGLPKFLDTYYIYVENVDGVEVWKLMDPTISKLLRNY